MPNPIKIENTKDVIDFEIFGKVYSVPLATGLERPDLEKLQTQKDLENYFREQIGAEVWDKLLVGAQNQIAAAWDKANREASGLSTGE